MLVPVFAFKYIFLKHFFFLTPKTSIIFFEHAKSKSKLYTRLGLFYKYLYFCKTDLMHVTIYHNFDWPAHLPYLTLSGVRSGITSGNKCATHPFAISRSTSHISSNVAKNPMTANPSTMGPINESSELNTSENMDAVFDDLSNGV